MIRPTRTALVATSLLTAGALVLPAAAGAAPISCQTLACEPPLPPPPPPSGTTVAIDADTLRAVQIQENSWYSNGDEVYVAQIGFRSTPGQAGSTRAFFQGGLSEMTGIRNGTVRSIPDAMGRVTFTNVTRRGVADVLQGRNPELVGTLTVAFESDLTPFSTINTMMSSMATTARNEVAKIVEPLTFADLADPSAISARLSQAAARIRAEATPSTLGRIALFLGSAGDPDDVVGFKANVFLAVDSSLADTVDAQFGMGVPTSTGVAGALRPRTYTQRFAGAGAVYDITYRLTG